MVGNERGFFIKRMDSSSNRDWFGFCGIYGERWTWERGKNWQRKRYKRNRRGGWATKRRIFHIFLWIYVRAIKWISRSGPLMEALKHPRHWHNNRICSSLCATIDTNPRQFTPKRIHITAHRRPHERADVSTCLPITDCSGIVDREGGRSFSFGRPSCFSYPRVFASFASCNTVSHSSSLHSSFPLPRHLPRPFVFLHSVPTRLFVDPTGRRLSFSLLLHSPVLRPKGKSINSPGKIVTRNMEYWVRAKLPSSPSRTENEVPRQAAAMPVT